LENFTFDEPDQLEELSKKWPDGIALSDGTTSLTFAQVESMSTNLAAELVHTWRKARRPRFLPLMVDFGLESAVAALACIRFRIPFCPLELSTPPARLEMLLTRLGNPQEIWVPHRAGDDWIAKLNRNCDPYNSEDKQSGIYREVKNAKEGVVIFTSGTTGSPKGVVLSWPAFDKRWKLRARISEKTREEARTTLLVGLNWIVGLCRLARILAGVGVLRIDPAQHGLRSVLHEANRFGITHLSMPNQIARLIAESKLPMEMEMPTVIEVSLGGEAFRFEQLAKLAPMFNPKTVFHFSFGYSEAPLSFLYRSQFDSLPQEGKVGLGQLFDHETTRLEPIEPDGNVREIWCTGSIADEYLGQPDLTKMRFEVASDGRRWWKSGDLVQKDVFGQYFHFGRVDDLVKINGKLASPSETEAALLRIEGVRCALVVPSADPKGPHFIAHIEVNDIKAVSTREVKEYLRKVLEPHLVPKEIFLHGELPKTARGKVDRQKLINLKPSLP